MPHHVQSGNQYPTVSGRHNVMSRLAAIDGSIAEAKRAGETTFDWPIRGSSAAQSHGLGSFRASL